MQGNNNVFEELPAVLNGEASLPHPPRAVSLRAAVSRLGIWPTSGGVEGPG